MVGPFPAAYLQTAGGSFRLDVSPRGAWIYFRAPASRRWLLVFDHLPHVAACWGRPTDWKGVLLMELDNRRGQVTELQSPKQMVDSDAQTLFPFLHDFLTLPAFPDGQLRELPWLSIGCGDGSFKAFLNDRHNARTVTVSAQSLAGCFALLNDALGTNKVVWRYESNQAPGKYRRK